MAQPERKPIPASSVKESTPSQKRVFRDESSPKSQVVGRKNSTFSTTRKTGGKTINTTKKQTAGLMKKVLKTTVQEKANDKVNPDRDFWAKNPKSDDREKATKRAIRAGAPTTSNGNLVRLGSGQRKTVEKRAKQSAAAQIANSNKKKRS